LHDRLATEEFAKTARQQLVLCVLPRRDLSLSRAHFAQHLNFAQEVLERLDSQQHRRAATTLRDDQRLRCRSSAIYPSRQCRAKVYEVAHLARPLGLGQRVLGDLYIGLYS
jgi:hypothetical protein